MLKLKKKKKKETKRCRKGAEPDRLKKRKYEFPTLI